MNSLTQHISYDEYMFKAWINGISRCDARRCYLTYCTFDPLIRILDWSVLPLTPPPPHGARLDDLVTITGCHRHTQQISSIICLWITLVGLPLSPGTPTKPKLRLLTSFPTPGHICIYNWDWTRLDVPFSGSDDKVKILEVPITLNLDWIPAIKDNFQPHGMDITSLELVTMIFPLSGLRGSWLECWIFKRLKIWSIGYVIRHLHYGSILATFGN